MFKQMQKKYLQNHKTRWNTTYEIIEMPGLFAIRQEHYQVYISPILLERRDEIPVDNMKNALLHQDIRANNPGAVDGDGAIDDSNPQSTTW